MKYLYFLFCSLLFVAITSFPYDVSDRALFWWFTVIFEGWFIILAIRIVKDTVKGKEMSRNHLSNLCIVVGGALHMSSLFIFFLKAKTSQPVAASVGVLIMAIVIIVCLSKILVWLNKNSNTHSTT